MVIDEIIKDDKDDTCLKDSCDQKGITHSNFNLFLANLNENKKYIISLFFKI